MKTGILVGYNRYMYTPAEILPQLANEFRRAICEAIKAGDGHRLEILQKRLNGIEEAARIRGIDITPSPN
jgi:hypothetical protein